MKLKEFVKKNYLLASDRVLAMLFGCTEAGVRSCRHRLGLARTQEEITNLKYVIGKWHIYDKKAGEYKKCKVQACRIC